jgi:hypothetical protein
MAHIAVTLDRRGRLVSFTGDMAQGVEFERSIHDNVTKIRIAGEVAVRIEYDVNGNITKVSPDSAAAMLHLSFG